MGQIINGKEIALKIREELGEEVKKLKAEKGITPKLSVVLVGEDAASQVYVRNKEKACEKAGMIGETHRISASTSEKSLIDLVKSLNKQDDIDGVLVQLPLPKHLDARKVLDEIIPEKDVDGLHPLNLGKLLKSEDPLFTACTPQGIMQLLLSTGVEIKGKEAVVVGRSNIVGKPIALLLLHQHATVTVCHSRTKDLGATCRRADILIASVGSAKLIKADMVKEGAIVIDVGMNRLDNKLCGDVDFEAVKEKASFITPVPGGVGPMTIAMLLKNTLIAAKRRASVL